MSAFYNILPFHVNYSSFLFHFTCLCFVAEIIFERRMSNLKPCGGSGSQKRLTYEKAVEETGKSDVILPTGLFCSTGKSDSPFQVNDCTEISTTRYLRKF